jgi:hypothetical protein
MRTLAKNQSRKKNRNINRQRNPGPNDISVVRPLRSKKDITYSAQLNAYSALVDISASGIRGAQYIVISQFSLAASLLSVFDQYRIIEVSVTLVPQCVTSFITAGTIATVAPTGVYNTSVLVTAIDQDDATTPASEDVVLAHESAIIHGPFIRPMTRTFKPMVAGSVYQTGGFGGYNAESDKWIDSASNNVQHYGFKYALSHGTTAPTGTVYMSVYLECKAQFRKTF